MFSVYRSYGFLHMHVCIFYKIVNFNLVTMYNRIKYISPILKSYELHNHLYNYQRGFCKHPFSVSKFSHKFVHNYIILCVKYYPAYRRNLATSARDHQKE